MTVHNQDHYMVINRLNAIGTFFFNGKRGLKKYLFIKNTFNRYSVISSKDKDANEGLIYTHKNFLIYCYHYVYDTHVGYQPQETYVTV